MYLTFKSTFYSYADSLREDIISLVKQTDNKQD